jgi:hypothetical protein
LRQRNAANDAWIVVGLLNQSTNTFNVPVAQGGTGAATLTANNVLLGNGTSAVQAVAPGTSGNVLTSNGTTWQSSVLAAANLSGRVPAANAPLGSVIQVVSVVLPANFSTTSTSFVDVTNFAATITPSSATSKILAIVNARVQNNSGSNINNRGSLRLIRGTTQLSEQFIGAFLGGVSGTDLNNYHSVSAVHLDSPSTTNAVTYKVTAQSGDSQNTMQFLATGSTITIMEIAA